MKVLRDGAADRPARDDAIFKNLFSLPYFTEGESFFLYNAFGSEAATARIVRELLARGRQVYLPRVEGREMLPVRYVGQPLSVGRYGIAEPQGEAFGGFPQVCLLPMLAADRACRRLGYGGGYYDLSDTAFLQELAGQAARAAADFGVLEDYKLRFCRVETPAGERLVFSDISSEQATLEGLARSLAVTGALSFAAFLGLSLLLARWAVKPVERAWRQQQQFVADASHELKTPLAVITTNAELLGGVGEAGPAGRILATARQMRALVEGLLELARADGGGAEAPMQRVDWSALAEEALLPFEPLLFERGLTLTPCIQPGITVRGREGPLRQVLEILLDNAQKYAVPPSAVYLHLARSGRSRCRLMVENRAATLPPEELENIFKRFYRVDKARSRDGSFGLGLPIARQIVSAHRGRIWAESHGERIRFYVELPLA